MQGLPSMDYWVYTAAGFILAVSALLVMAHVILLILRANAQLQDKLMAMTAQFPHKAYLDLQGQGLELQKLQWEHAAEQARGPAQPVHIVPDEWQSQEAGS